MDYAGRTGESSTALGFDGQIAYTKGRPRRIKDYGEPMLLCVIIYYLAAGDLSGDNKVDFADYSMFAEHWLSYCPDGWLLK